MEDYHDTFEESHDGCDGLTEIEGLGEAFGFLKTSYCLDTTAVQERLDNADLERENQQEKKLRSALCENSELRERLAMAESLIKALVPDNQNPLEPDVLDRSKLDITMHQMKCTKQTSDKAVMAESSPLSPVPSASNFDPQEANELKEKLEAVESVLHSERSGWHCRLAGLEVERTTLQSQMSELQCQLKSSPPSPTPSAPNFDPQETAELREKLEALESVLRSERSGWHCRLAELEVERTTLQSQMSELQCQLKVSIESNASTQANLEVIENQLKCTAETSEIAVMTEPSSPSPVPSAPNFDPQEADELREKLEAVESVLHSERSGWHCRLAELEVERTTLQSQMSELQCQLKSSMLNPSPPDLGSDPQEISRIKQELKAVESVLNSDRSAWQRHLTEIEVDRTTVQSEMIELQRQLKDTRDELADTRAQLEAMDGQPSYTTQSRCNLTITEDLREENHRLVQKLQLAHQMEVAYLEEIEHLKESSRSFIANPPVLAPVLNQSHLSELEERFSLVDAENEVLKGKLRSALAETVEIRQQLAVAESCINTSTSSFLLTNPDLDSAVQEAAQLRQKLETMETVHNTELSTWQRHITELEEDRTALQSQMQEMQRHLNESRNELADTRAQLEAIELQSNCIAKTRGNSAFSELEDRRIRAEKLVVQQRKMIDGLHVELCEYKVESERKLIEETMKLERRFHERDTQYTNSLGAERDRLMDENHMLQLEVQHLKEMQLDEERRSLKLSQAFNPESNNTNTFIKKLERQMLLLQRRLKENAQTINELRERCLNAHLSRRDMQRELWQQTDMVTKLAKQLEQYETAGTCPPPISIGRTNTRLDDAVSGATVEQPAAPADKLPSESPDGCENTDPESKNQTNHIEPTKSTTSKLQSPRNPPMVSMKHLPPTAPANKVEMPPECKTT